MDEAMEQRSIVPEDFSAGIRAQNATPDEEQLTRNELLLYQIKAIEAQTRELAHIGDALSLLTNHLAVIAKREEGP